MTYNEAYNKIIDAYFKDKIKPLSSFYCVCGTLHGSSFWRYGSNGEIYSFEDYQRIEHALLSKMRFVLYKDKGSIYFYDKAPKPYQSAIPIVESNPKYEQALFEGMCAALDVLKQIHISRGEVIDSPKQFTKRTVYQRI